MIACSLATAHVSIYADIIGQPVTKALAQQQVVKAKPCIHHLIEVWVHS